MQDLFSLLHNFLGYITTSPIWVWLFSSMVVFGVCLVIVSLFKWRDD